MTRYIDVEALMKELGIADDCDNCAWNGEGKCMKGEGFADACVAMEDAPTADVVKMVRCKDCIYLRNTGAYSCDLLDFWLDDTEGFCKWGERREE